MGRTRFWWRSPAWVRVAVVVIVLYALMFGVTLTVRGLLHSWSRLGDDLISASIGGLTGPTMLAAQWWAGRRGSPAEPTGPGTPEREPGTAKKHESPNE
ncbi:hypothetical protein [Actinokineospora sp. NBRC 105648]|uniref:hypothetical protein n=1 Tax=Actinokineospora sp. NBRC 105648 TaxID=3032206 RepID=UPI0024A2FAB1|nr:hypothetical protein [Actinokineospora sp. NBRC 105648]GLZ37365.1 hypothetical protein Acsp05_09900 [Actinokineospora sp. NBRC 105648]